MKQLFVIFLIGSQLSGLFQKTLTIVHFLYHQEEIIEHFCHHDTHEEEENCQGICYLKIKLNKEENTAHSHIPASALVQDEIGDCQNLPYFTLSYPFERFNTTPKAVIQNLVLQNVPISVWRPPTTV